MGLPRGRNSRLYLALGVAFGLLAVLSGLGITKGVGDRAREMGGWVRIPVAARELRPGETLEASALSWSDFPERFLPRGIVIDPQGVLGKRLAAGVGEGEPLFLSQLDDFRPALDPTTLPPGMCVFPLPSQAISFPAWEIKPGQRLHVISIGEADATVLLEDVEVMALSLPSQDRPSQEYSSEGHVFLKLTEDEACLLARALRKGQVEVVLASEGSR
jgi:Flp pilus assembly protein CpaB